MCWKKKNKKKDIVDKNLDNKVSNFQNVSEVTNSEQIKNDGLYNLQQKLLEAFSLYNQHGKYRVGEVNINGSENGFKAIYSDTPIDYEAEKAAAKAELESYYKKNKKDEIEVDNRKKVKVSAKKIGDHNTVGYKAEYKYVDEIQKDENKDELKKDSKK